MQLGDMESLATIRTGKFLSAMIASLQCDLPKRATDKMHGGGAIKIFFFFICRAKKISTRLDSGFGSRENAASKTWHPRKCG